MSTLDELKKIIARVARCSADEIGLDTALKDIKADSLHWVQIVIAAEELLNTPWHTTIFADMAH